jgi:hypothetical protein
MIERQRQSRRKDREGNGACEVKDVLEVQVQERHHGDAEVCTTEKGRHLCQVIIPDRRRHERPRLLCLRRKSALDHVREIQGTYHRVRRVDILEHRLVVLRLDLRTASAGPARPCGGVRPAHLLRDKEVGADDEDLARDVADAHVVERVGVVERDPAGHCGRTAEGDRQKRERKERTRVSKKIGVRACTDGPCMTTSEMTMFWMAGFDILKERRERSGWTRSRTEEATKRTDRGQARAYINWEDATCRVACPGHVRPGAYSDRS